MNHASDDTLLLLAYGEVEREERELARAHLAGCAACRARLEPLERASVALDYALSLADGPSELAARHLPVIGHRASASVEGAVARHQPRRSRWFVALAAAAALAAVLLRSSPEPPRPLALALPRYSVPALAPIDSILTHLEQERPYAIP